MGEQPVGRLDGTDAQRIGLFLLDDRRDRSEPGAPFDLLAHVSLERLVVGAEEEGTVSQRTGAHLASPVVDQEQVSSCQGIDRALDVGIREPHVATGSQVG